MYIYIYIKLDTSNDIVSIKILHNPLHLNGNLCTPYSQGISKAIKTDKT